MEIGSEIYAYDLEVHAVIGDLWKVVGHGEYSGDLRVQLVSRIPKPVILKEGSTFDDPAFLLRLPSGTIIDRDDVRCYIGTSDDYPALVSMEGGYGEGCWPISAERKSNVRYTIRLFPVDGPTQVEI